MSINILFQFHMPKIALNIKHITLLYFKQFKEISVKSDLILVISKVNSADVYQNQRSTKFIPLLYANIHLCSKKYSIAITLTINVDFSIFNGDCCCCCLSISIFVAAYGHLVHPGHFGTKL